MENGTEITGKQLMDAARQKMQEVQNLAGETLAYLDCEPKRLRIALRRKRKCERACDLRIVRHDRGSGIPINIWVENRNLPSCKLFKVLHLSDLDIALRKYINACGRIVDFDVVGRLHHIV